MRAQIQGFYWEERAPKRDIHDLTQTPCLEGIRQYSSAPAGVSMGSAIGQLSGTRMVLIITHLPPKSIRQIKQNLKIIFSLRYGGGQVLKSWSITMTSKHILKCVCACERDKFPGL